MSSRDEICQLKGAKLVLSICHLCPWQCLTEVYVRDSQIVYVRGNEEGPNRSSRCVKGEASAYFTRDPDRLRHPMVRTGRKGEGKFERISWDEALATIAAKLMEIKEKYGPEALAFMWHLDSNVMFPYALFAQLYGTPNCYGHNAACLQDRTLAAQTVFGHLNPVRDYENSRFVMLLGANPFEANQSLFETAGLIVALERGAKIVVVDPVYSQTAMKADEWLPIRPGTDGALALAMTRVILDEGLYDAEFAANWILGLEPYWEHLRENGYDPKWAAGITEIPEETIVRLAREFAAVKSAVADVGKGLGNYLGGLDASRVVFILNALTGSVGGPGNLILKEWAPLALPVQIPEDQQTMAERPPLHTAMGFPLAPDLPSALLPRAILAGEPYPIKALFFHSTNPVMSEMSKADFTAALRELELSVAIDLYMSETAMECDLVLPEASQYERAEIRQGLWLGPQIILGQPAVPPVGESKPLYDIVRDLARHMGYGAWFSWDSWEDWARVALADAPVSLEELRENGFWSGEVRYRNYEETGFGTLSGKIELFSSILEENGYNPLPCYISRDQTADAGPYTFQLVNSKLASHCNVSTQNNPYLVEMVSENWAEVNPADAKEHGLKDRDYAVLESPLGEVRIRLRLTERVSPGVVAVRHGHGFGRWAGGRIARGRGAHINPLIGVHVGPVSGANAYNEGRVRLRKA
ncbi:MAG: molybdopterin-dependent oxidoreductase [Chloroflexi bacterium]|nr:molybdopterin-dependent oxidoreductase [Chloroflexota bacterium]